MTRRDASIAAARRKYGSAFDRTYRAFEAAIRTGLPSALKLRNMFAAADDPGEAVMSLYDSDLTRWYEAQARR